MSDKEEMTGDTEPQTKRKRGRPSKPKPEHPEEPKPKRPRGRPLGSKKKPEEPNKPKRPRGRPRKAPRPRGRPSIVKTAGAEEFSALEYASSSQSPTHAEIKHEILMRIDAMRAELTQLKQMVNRL